MFKKTLIILSTLLFIFNSDICDMYYDSSTETAEWWALRFKLKSVLFTMLGLLVFLIGDRKIKILSIPMLAMFIGNMKDRIIFNDPTRGWADVLLVVLSISIMIKIWHNDKSRE